RIVGGDLRGRTLHTVRGQSTRPTADRVRQSLFDRLGQRCDGLRVLDLYAGTGALAFEALSRGAAHATLVEADARAAQVIERNAVELGCAARCTLVRDEVERALPRLRGPYDLVFSDPPYALRAAQPTLDALAAAGLVPSGGRVVLERDRREPQPLPADGFELEDERRYGDTLVLIVRRR
ncbi:MAG TPA: 16S rRNA (guanine(966)-N(2))-methyltransferase RsmD, partial [Myxococcales bacterium]|nr:16S rRNA (guanine(966)-N(2))-methyltransferase RsmD [Myxococcales bacterium]